MLKTAFLLPIFIFLLIQPATAGVLQERKTEVSFDFIYDDTDNFGKTIAFDGSVLYILSNGYVEAGGELGYIKLDLDGFESIDGFNFGPRVDINFTPNNNWTGFATATFFFFGGDFGDFYESGASVGIGIKAFVAPSAGVRMVLTREKLFGKDFYEDSDSTFLEAGFSVFLD